MALHQNYVRMHSIAEIAPGIQVLLVEYRVGPDGLKDFPNEDEFKEGDKAYLWFNACDLAGDSSIRFFGYRDVLKSIEEAIAEAKECHASGDNPDAWVIEYED